MAHMDVGGGERSEVTRLQINRNFSRERRADWIDHQSPVIVYLLFAFILWILILSYLPVVFNFCFHNVWQTHFSSYEIKNCLTWADLTWKGIEFDHASARQPSALPQTKPAEKLCIQLHFNFGLNLFIMQPSSPPPPPPTPPPRAWLASMPFRHT